LVVANLRAARGALLCGRRHLLGGVERRSHRQSGLQPLAASLIGSMQSPTVVSLLRTAGRLAVSASPTAQEGHQPGV